MQQDCRNDCWPRADRPGHLNPYSYLQRQARKHSQTCKAPTEPTPGSSQPFPWTTSPLLFLAIPSGFTKYGSMNGAGTRKMFAGCACGCMQAGVWVTAMALEDSGKLPHSRMTELTNITCSSSTCMHRCTITKCSRSLTLFHRTGCEVCGILATPVADEWLHNSTMRLLVGMHSLRTMAGGTLPGKVDGLVAGALNAPETTLARMLCGFKGTSETLSHILYPPARV